MSAEEPDGRLSPDRLDAVLAAIGDSVGLDPTGARLMKFTNSAVFDLPAASAVVRIAGSNTVTQRVPKVIRVAEWLAAHDFPAVRLLARVDQPVRALGHVATVWHRVPAVGPEPTTEDLAGLLVRFHALPQPDDLPPWEPLGEIRQRLAEAEGVEVSDLAFLEDRCDTLEADLGELSYALPAGVIHGDAFLGNLIPGPDGPVMCDFDSTSVGPREWDLTPVAVGKLRFNYRNCAHEALSERYGFDVTSWDGFSVLRQVRELKLVTSVLPILRSNPSIRGQFQHRLQSFKAGDSARWQPYAASEPASR